MKKILIMMITFFVMLSSANAVLFNANQDETISEFERADISSVQDFVVFGNDNLNVTTADNFTYEYDVRNFFSYLDNTLYLKYVNSVENNSINILVTEITVGDVANNLLTSYNVSLAEVGTYYFKFDPTYSGENIYIELNIDDTVSQVQYITTKNVVVENINSITNTFVSSIKDLIDINIGFWKMLYYLFILIVILSGVGLLIGFGFKLYEWSEKLGDRKRAYFNGLGKGK